MVKGWYLPLPLQLDQETGRRQLGKDFSLLQEKESIDECLSELLKLEEDFAVAASAFYLSFLCHLDSNVLVLSANCHCHQYLSNVSFGIKL